MPRRRFLPVKTCSDLLLVMSNLYDMKHGRLEMSPLRQFPSVPIVQLSGGYFKKVRGQNFMIEPVICILEMKEYIRVRTESGILEKVWKFVN